MKWSTVLIFQHFKSFLRVFQYLFLGCVTITLRRSKIPSKNQFYPWLSILTHKNTYINNFLLYSPAFCSLWPSFKLIYMKLLVLSPWNNLECLPHRQMTEAQQKRLSWFNIRGLSFTFSLQKLPSFAALWQSNQPVPSACDSEVAPAPWHRAFLHFEWKTKYLDMSYDFCLDQLWSVEKPRDVLKGLRFLCNAISVTMVYLRMCTCRCALTAVFSFVFNSNVRPFGNGRAVRKECEQTAVNERWIWEMSRGIDYIKVKEVIFKVESSEF